MHGGGNPTSSYFSLRIVTDSINPYQAGFSTVLVAFYSEPASFRPKVSLALQHTSIQTSFEYVFKVNRATSIKQRCLFFACVWKRCAYTDNYSGVLLLDVNLAYLPLRASLNILDPPTRTLIMPLQYSSVSNTLRSNCSLASKQLVTPLLGQ